MKREGRRPFESLGVLLLDPVLLLKREESARRASCDSENAMSYEYGS